MKAILLSVQPKWVEKILKGEKTIEIRKSMPKCDLPIDVYIYQTKAKYRLLEILKKGCEVYGMTYEEEKPTFIKTYGSTHFDKGNGKVVAKFTLREVKEIGHIVEGLESDENYEYSLNSDSTLSLSDYLEQAGLTCDETLIYKGNSKFLYACHISNLMVFDKPMELGVFHKTCANDGSGCPDSDCPYYETPSYEYGEVNYDCYDLRPIKRPPQSWCFFDKIQSHCPKCLSTMEYCDGKWYCEGIMDCENKRGVLNETIF